MTDPNDTPESLPTPDAGSDSDTAVSAVASANAIEPVSAASAELLEKIIEALLLASDQPLSIDQLHRLLGDDLGVARKDLRDALDRLGQRLDGRASELVEVASGFRIQVRSEYAEWVARLWQEKPQRFSRALLETLALICYRQPITRGEIEEVRGVQVSSNILRTLLERGWVRELGVKEVPGRPALFGTTPQFLDDFNLKSLDQLPSLPEIKDLNQLDAALAQLAGELPDIGEPASDDDAVEGDTHADGIDAPRTRPADDAAADGNAGADADAGDTGAEPAGDDAAHDAASDGAAAPPDEESRG
jgi:segregation and condensation protein B